MKKFIFLAVLLTIARYADIQTTYFSTPDLKAEANPLVSLFGLGWTGLLFAQTILLGMLIYACWVYSFKSVQTPAINNQLSLNKFVFFFYFNNTNSFFKIFYKLPTNKNSLLYSIGYIATYSLIVWSILVSGSTILLLVNKGYRDFYTSNNLWIVLYILGFGIFIFFSVKFFRNEYKMRTVL